jgi:hypothetical protein
VIQGVLVYDTNKPPRILSFLALLTPLVLCECGRINALQNHFKTQQVTVLN